MHLKTMLMRATGTDKNNELADSKSESMKWKRTIGATAEIDNVKLSLKGTPSTSKQTYNRFVNTLLN